MNWCSLLGDHRFEKFNITMPARILATILARILATILARILMGTILARILVVTILARILAGEARSYMLKMNDLAKGIIYLTQKFTLGSTLFDEGQLLSFFDIFLKARMSHAQFKQMKNEVRL
jgi:hypothetical protein